jgi:hypothetical protein
MRGYRRRSILTLTVSSVESVLSFVRKKFLPPAPSSN